MGGVFFDNRKEKSVNDGKKSIHLNSAVYTDLGQKGFQKQNPTGIASLNCSLKTDEKHTA